VYTELGFDEPVGLLVDREWSDRENRALTRRLQLARLRDRSASIEDIRPELKAGESFQDELDVDAAIKGGVLTNPAAMMPLWGKLRASRPPESLLRAIVNSLGDRYYGLEALAIASLRERGDHTTWIEALPDIPGFATTPDQKLATARSWVRC
jgi:hypothetical protein